MQGRICMQHATHDKLIAHIHRRRGRGGLKFAYHRISYGAPLCPTSASIDNCRRVKRVHSTHKYLYVMNICASILMNIIIPLWDYILFKYAKICCWIIFYDVVLVAHCFLYKYTFAAQSYCFLLRFIWCVVFSPLLWILLSLAVFNRFMATITLHITYMDVWCVPWQQANAMDSERQSVCSSDVYYSRADSRLIVWTKLRWYVEWEQLDDRELPHYRHMPNRNIDVWENIDERLLSRLGSFLSSFFCGEFDEAWGKICEWSGHQIPLTLFCLQTNRNNSELAIFMQIGKTWDDHKIAPSFCHLLRCDHSRSRKYDSSFLYARIT